MEMSRPLQITNKSRLDEESLKLLQQKRELESPFIERSLMEMKTITDAEMVNNEDDLQKGASLEMDPIMVEIEGSDRTTLLVDMDDINPPATPAASSRNEENEQSGEVL